LAVTVVFADVGLGADFFGIGWKGILDAAYVSKPPSLKQKEEAQLSPGLACSLTTDH
jgi:hypothetical protein